MQIVEEKRADHLKNVALVGVMPADLTPLLRFHNNLEQRTEDGRRNARPVEERTAKQSVAHIPVEIREIEILGEEFAVDVGECRESFVELFLAFIRWRIQYGKEVREVLTQVGAIFGCPV